MRHFGFQVLYSTKNHHVEVMSYVKSFASVICAVVTSDKYFLFNTLISSNIDILNGSKFRLDHGFKTVRATKIDRFQLKRIMALSHQQPYAFCALSGNHILKMNEIVNIVDQQYLKVCLKFKRFYENYSSFLKAAMTFGNDTSSNKRPTKCRNY